MSEEKLRALRQEIDRIDEQLIDLLAARLKLANDLVAIKRRLGKDIRDVEREREVVALARRRARERGLDPTFAEWVMRLTIAQMAGAQMERAGVGLWNKVQKAFEGQPAQLNVVRILLKYGLRVREDGEIACGDIRIPAVQIAKEAGVDRRVVDAAARRILQDSELREIFSNLEPIAYLKGVSRALGLGVIEILPKDAKRPGIISEVTGAISKFGISIRQAVADDPYFTPQPKLTIITDEPVKGEVIEALRKLPSVQSVIVY
jgi:predicted regulator of amino acid metabolism with ACT domain/chorismate mutase